MKHPPTCGEPVKIKNAQPDSYMFGNIAKNAKFSIGSQHLCWDVIIADISDDLLLGLDFLKAHEGKIDFKKGIVTLMSEDIQAFPKRQKRERIQESWIKTKSTS